MVSVLYDRHQYRIPANRDLTRLCESLNRRRERVKIGARTGRLRMFRSFFDFGDLIRLIAKQRLVVEAKKLFVRNEHPFRSGSTK